MKVYAAIASWLSVSAWAAVSTARADTSATLGLSPELYDNMTYFSEMVTVSYCQPQPAPGTLLECEGNTCDTVKKNMVSVISPFGGGAAKILGFVAADHVRKEIAVVFRGTASLENVIADGVFPPVPWSYCQGCLVHLGFKTSWEAIKEEVKDLAQSAKRVYPDYHLVLTGHSLGGAIAQLAAMELRFEGGIYKDVPQYTYGSPRVGNQAFADYIMAGKGQDYRVTHHGDIILTIAPLSLGFRHPFPEYYLAAGPPSRSNYGIDDIEVCTGVEQLQCAETSPNFSLDGHMRYFRNMWTCYQPTQ